MLGRMNRTRLAALAVLALIIAAACQGKLNNGEGCLKDVDCESDRCIQAVCVEPKAAQVPAGATDTGTETAADAPAETAASDTAPPAPDTAEAGSDTSDASAD
jgi:hypothetical protein